MAEDKKDVPFDAPWTGNLKHRSDPNRVGSVQVLAHDQRYGMGATGSLPASVDKQGTGGQAARGTRGMGDSDEATYYDVPMLKEPVWKWQIATYFYLGGISAGAYILGRAAERFGGRKHRDLTRIASYLALTTLIPCPPLLIADLGDPKRFHHMLRVFKPGTPMNLGTWSIVAYSGMAAYEAVRQYLTQQDRQLSAGERSKLLKVMNNGVLLAVHDAAGVPFALLVAGYTGVLLSCTANPLWCKNPWLGPLFSASAVSTGAEAVSLTMDLSGADSEASQTVLQKVDTAAHVAELACMQGFKHCAGESAKAMHRGSLRKHQLISMGGIFAAEVLKRLPVGQRYRKPLRIAASALGLVAGFSMRWEMVFGGHKAAADPHLDRVVSQPRQKTNTSRDRKEAVSSDRAKTAPSRSRLVAAPHPAV